MIIATVTEAADVLRPLFASSEGESVAVIHLDDERRMLAVTLEKVGSQAEVELPVRSILEKALRIGSHGIVVAHNHPSGDANPSPADERATRALADAATRVGILVYDHLIFAGEECSSFRSLGLL